MNPALTEQLPDDAALCLYAGLREEYADERDARCLATRDIRLARRLVDCLFRGHGAAFTLGLWGHVCAGEDRYIKPYKPRANLLLDTTHTYEVCLWSTVLDTMPADPALTATQARQLAALRENLRRSRRLALSWCPKTACCGSLLANNAIQFTENIHLRVANRAAIGYNRPKSHGRTAATGLKKEVLNYV